MQISKMHFVPGDQLMVSVPEPMSAEVVKRIREQLKEWSAGCPTIIIPSDRDYGVQVENIRRQDSRRRWAAYR